MRIAGVVGRTDLTAPDLTAPDIADGLAPYADTVLDAFGPERLPFGSDWPVCTLQAGHGGTVRVADRLADGLRAAEKDAVFHGNAARVYGLRPPARP